MSDNGNSGGSSTGDSDSSSMSESRVCRDFIRNVCRRGNSCRFAHPGNIKVRTDPIFCHDFQIGRCFRSSCKFVHCTREEEDHYRETGELIESAAALNVCNNGDLENNGMHGSTPHHPNKNHRNGNVVIVEDETPICKDFLKGMCERGPGGCKFRHVSTRQVPGTFPRGVRNQNNVRMIMPVVGGRRKARELYDEGPERKRYLTNEYDDDFKEDPFEASQYEENYSPKVHGGGNAQNQNCCHHGPTRNGYQPDAYVPIPHLQSPGVVKALEDENFMLKRRIEELKTSNEFLLAQNAQLSQLRLNNSLSVGTSVAAQVQPLAVSAVSVSTAGPAAQPSIIGITSSSLSGTQPLPTISISTLPTVTPVSISQTLQPAPQSQPQIFLPAPPN